MLFFIRYQVKKLNKYTKIVGTKRENSIRKNLKLLSLEARYSRALQEVMLQRSRFGFATKTTYGKFKSCLPWTVAYAVRRDYVTSIENVFCVLSDIEKKIDNFNKNQISNNPGLESLFKTIQYNREIDEIISQLVDININAKHPKTHMTLLGHAAIHGTEEVVQLLLDNGANPQLKVAGETPSELAICNDRHNIAKLIDAKIKKSQSAPSIPVMSRISYFFKLASNKDINDVATHRITHACPTRLLH